MPDGPGRTTAITWAALWAVHPARGDAPRVEPPSAGVITCSPHATAHAPTPATAPKIFPDIRGQGLTVGKLNMTNVVQPSGECL